MSGLARPGKKNPYQIYNLVGHRPSVAGIIHAVERFYSQGRILFTWAKGNSYDFDEPFNDPPLADDRYRINEAQDGFLLNPNSRYPNNPETGLPSINWTAEKVPNYDPTHAPVSGEGFTIMSNYFFGSPRFDPEVPLGPTNHVALVYNSALTISDEESEILIDLIKKEVV